GRFLAVGPQRRGAAQLLLQPVLIRADGELDVVVLRLADDHVFLGRFIAAEELEPENLKGMRRQRRGHRHAHETRNDSETQPWRRPAPDQANTLHITTIALARGCHRHDYRCHNLKNPLSTDRTGRNLPMRSSLVQWPPVTECYGTACSSSRFLVSAGGAEQE